ncbi:MAG: hypothetical protein LBJ24_03720 [Treponema sp.]|jgi:hypothetical protein|nr:hypothetical protein [Treponema sp.]
MKGQYTGLALTALVLFTSCIGIKSDIVIRGDESGTINLEYRIARGLESMGKLDGTEKWPPGPVGRTDFERTAARVPGLRVASFSSRTEDGDLVNRIRLEFASLDALTGFLDAGGNLAALYREQGGTRLVLVLGGGNSGAADPALLELVRSSAETYRLDFSLTLPGDGAFTFIDSTGRSLAGPPAGAVNIRGRTAAFSCPIGDLLASAEPVILEMRW